MLDSKVYSALSSPVFFTKVWSGRPRKFVRYTCVCGNTREFRADTTVQHADCGCGHAELGKQYSRLTVTGRGLGYRCLCICGEQIDVGLANLKSGKVKSCGCYAREVTQFQLGVSHGVTHGASNTETYRIWSDMRNRCKNSNNRGHKFYGARGITVADSWENFETFLADMGIRPAGLTLERLDNSKGYCKENCIWASVKQQANNRRSNLVITYAGRAQTLKLWCEELNLSYTKMAQRIQKLSWSVEKAFSTP